MVTKRVQITFDEGLPLGTHGSFVYEKRRWIAVPLDKWTETVTVTDRLLGVLARVRAQLTQWVGIHPVDAARTVMILQVLEAAEASALIHEKQRAQTS
jgi:hypothetical protein